MAQGWLRPHDGRAPLKLPAKSQMQNQTNTNANARNRSSRISPKNTEPSTILARKPCLPLKSSRASLCPEPPNRVTERRAVVAALLLANGVRVRLCYHLSKGLGF